MLVCGWFMMMTLTPVKQDNSSTHVQPTQADGKKKNEEGFFKMQFPPSALFQFTVRSVICFCFFPEDII